MTLLPPLPSASLVTYERSHEPIEIAKTIRIAHERKAARAWDTKSKATLQPKPASKLESMFRHGAWAETRARVRAALVACGKSTRVIERFDNCGASCEVMVRLDGQGAKLSARYCRNRFCVPCCKARARVITQHLLDWTAGEDAKMITLTMRPVGESLEENLSHLLKSFSRLRASNSWKSHVTAGGYCIEITRGEHKDHWHVHLHAIVLCRYYTQSELSDAWKVASRGSFRVDIRPCSDNGDGIRYAAEYASKGWSSECLENENWIVECVGALHGRRLFGTFGGWRGRSCEPDAEPIDGFRHVGALVEIIKHAARGEQWAVGICKMIGVAVISDAGSVAFVRLKRGGPAPGEVDPYARGGEDDE